MIYLIRTINVNVDTREIVDLLKIGYTDDLSSSNRFSMYKLHNPLCKILFTIPGGDKQDETNLHYNFRKYLFSGCGREWFTYSEDIINYFSTHTTKDSLSDLAVSNGISRRIRVKLNTYIKKFVNRWLCLDYSRPEKNSIDEVIDSYISDTTNVRNIEQFTRKIVGDYKIPEDIVKGILDFIEGKITNPKKIEDTLNAFNSLEGFRDKLRCICECPITEEERLILLDQVPLNFKNYYTVLGPEKCYSLGYDVTKVSRAYSDALFDKNKLRDAIYSTFSVGSRYAMSEIKTTLGNLYKSLGYNKSPMSVDLEEYFELKRALVTVDGKRVNAFELLKKERIKIRETRFISNLSFNFFLIPNRLYHVIDNSVGLSFFCG